MFSLTNLNRALPGQQKLLALGLLVLMVHLGLLMGSGDSLWRLNSESQKLGPLQTRILAPATLSPEPAAKTAAQAAPNTQRPTPKAPAAPAQGADTSPAGMSAIASPALPEPPKPPEPLPAMAQEVLPATNAPPTPVDTATASPEKSSDTPTPQISQEKALVAKAGSFPENVQINYTLTGRERGLDYFASGVLKWQVKPAGSTPRNYEAELRVRAFLVGSRIWRSQGVLAEDGLVPKRYSDSWRGERAAHFDPEQRTISFSGNTPSAALQAGAQDQVSLFIQMAAAVTAQNIQTATARDAVNWRLTYQSDEPIDVKGERLETQRWICLPRGKFDSQIEMWLSQKYGGMPVRIKITQSSGSFVDLEMNSSEALSALTP